MVRDVLEPDVLRETSPVLRGLRSSNTSRLPDCKLSSLCIRLAVVTNHMPRSWRDTNGNTGGARHRSDQNCGPLHFGVD